MLDDRNPGHDGVRGGIAGPDVAAINLGQIVSERATAIPVPANGVWIAHPNDTVPARLAGPVIVRMAALTHHKGALGPLDPRGGL